MHTAAAVFPTYLKGGHVLQSQLQGYHQTSASHEWHKTVPAAEAEPKGSASPKKQELGYPLFSSFLCWWVSALFKGAASCMGSTSGSLRALDCQGVEGIAMARHLYQEVVLVSAWDWALSLQSVDSSSLNHPSSQKQKVITWPNAHFLKHKLF